MPSSPHRTPSPSPTAPGGLDVLVVGAGFAGLYLLHRLRGLGLRALALEAGAGIGGTWYWNRYPGARCDVESMDYSYSFDPALEQEWSWTRRYPGQAEILGYIEHVADRFDLRRDVRTDTRAAAAAWDGADRVWRVRTDGGTAYAARYLVMATGCLSVPKAPGVDGLERFRGRVLHTGRWPHEEVDFTGRRVAVIGTGSSGIQAVPVIAEAAAEVTVFQRTANFSLPANDRPLAPDEQDAVKRRYREHRARARRSPTGVPGPKADLSALEVSEEERTATYRQAWEHGGLFGMLRSYNDLSTDADANATAADFIRARIAEAVDDPATAEALTPRSHPFGTKRPCIDSGYYTAFNRDGVRLVDLRAEPLAGATPGGVATARGEYPADDLVLATGYDAMTGALTAVNPCGRGGLHLRDAWAEGPTAHLGLAVAGFPNMFTVTGPGSPSVLSNMVVSIEQHVEWISGLIASAYGQGAEVVEADPGAQRQWVAHVQEVAAATLFPRADSWYMGANVPGKPRVFLPYPGGVDVYRDVLDGVAASGYEGFRLSRA
ncbi:flavin-containing monooxygenase [Nocardiopsis chromatogenes]|uniref:flavin-containing monooxygenase n=1 Tax=Nocardiopsis chromatogenes TaxID=280239 RepID=UPI00034B6C4B|nr:NAD(P)/FAD-dependent oxidoreductase [Nocardiopsis chromatogenes]